MERATDETRYQRGLANLVQISGKAGEEVVAPLGDLGRYIVEFAYADIYGRAVLSVREREIATVALLTAMGGREPQLRVHFQAARKAGVTLEELKEIIIQTFHTPGSPPQLTRLIC